MLSLVYNLTQRRKGRKEVHSASERYTLDNPRLSERSECSLGIRSKRECPLRASERFRHVVCTYKAISYKTTIRI